MCTETKKPHVHAELIKAWADGAEIQCYWIAHGWLKCPSPSWREDRQFRIKPEPKPDVVSFCHVRGTDTWRRPEIHITSAHNWNETQKPTYCYPANVKFIFDGETGKLKAVSLIKE